MRRVSRRASVLLRVADLVRWQKLVRQHSRELHWSNRVVVAFAEQQQDRRIPSLQQLEDHAEARQSRCVAQQYHRSIADE